jgi:repressor LexA
MLEKIRVQKIFGERLKEAREQNNLTIKSLSEIIHLTEATLSRYENGLMGAKRTTINELAFHLKVNPIWLLGYDAEKYTIENNQTSKPIPILGKIAAGTPILAHENIEGYEFVPENSKADFCLRVQGDSMNGARIYNNDLVFIRQQNIVETGEIAAVQIDGENATLKRFYKMGNQIILRSENHAYKEQIYNKSDFKEIKILGKCLFAKFEIN